MVKPTSTPVDNIGIRAHELKPRDIWALQPGVPDAALQWWKVIAIIPDPKDENLLNVSYQSANPAMSWRRGKQLDRAAKVVIALEEVKF
jgi:hypothetical protein